MPKRYRRASRRSGKRRRRGRRRSYRRLPRYRTKRIPVGLPDKAIYKLKYTEILSFDAGVGTFSTNVFRCNSIFDPNFTGVGHQPMYHDELAGLYERYLVIGSKLHVRFMHTSSAGSTTNPMMVYVWSSDGSADAFSSSQQMMENKEVTWRILDQSATSVTAHVNLSKGFNPRKAFQLGRGSVMNASGIGAAFGSNPSTQHFWHMGVVGIDGDPGRVVGIINIQYIVICRDVDKPMTQS